MTSKNKTVKDCFCPPCVCHFKLANSKMSKSEKSTKDQAGECDSSTSKPRDVLLKDISRNCSYLWRSTSRSISKIDFNGYVDSLSKRPWLALLLILGTLMTIIVVTTFIFIMATTIAVAITGIILIEGTIVTVGVIVFCGCLLSIWILVGVLVVVCASFYYGTYYFHNNLQYRDLLPMEGIKRIRNMFQTEQEDTSKKTD